jgi:hypothetical protein
VWVPVGRPEGKDESDSSPDEEEGESGGGAESLVSQWFVVHPEQIQMGIYRAAQMAGDYDSYDSEEDGSDDGGLPAGATVTYVDASELARLRGEL